VTAPLSVYFFSESMHAAWCLFASVLLVAVHAWDGPIAIVSIHSFPDVAEMQDTREYFCQWSSHKEYCDLHGYTCLFVVDSHQKHSVSLASEWNKEISNDPFNIAPHWFKVFVLRHVLPKFAAVLLMDADTMFQNLSRPLEPLLDAAGERWWLMADTKGITSHTMMLKNTDYSRAMVERLWNFRHVCPACPFGEQCAVHLVIYELLMDWAVQNGRNRTSVWNDNDGKESCCNPAAFCAYPTGVLSEHNPNHSYSVQGCSWNWWFALGPKRIKATHRHIYWVTEGDENNLALNVRHPIKDWTECWVYNQKFNVQTTPDPGRILTPMLLRRMSLMPNYHSGPRRKWRVTRAVEVETETNTTDFNGPGSFSVCHILPRVFPASSPRPHS